MRIEAYSSTMREHSVGLMEALVEVGEKLLSSDELVEVFTKGGLPEALAKGLTMMDIAIANGAEEAVYEADNRIVGRRHLKDFILENKEKWA